VCFQAQRCVLNALSPQAISVYDAVGKPSSIAARRTTVRPSTCAACAAFILTPSVVSLDSVCLVCRRWSAQHAVRLIDQSNLGGRAGKHTCRRSRTAFASGELCRLFHNTFLAPDSGWIARSSQGTPCTRDSHPKPSSGEPDAGPNIGRLGTAFRSLNSPEAN
jgi:hypothetical protein